MNFEVSIAHHCFWINGSLVAFVNLVFSVYALAQRAISCSLIVIVYKMDTARIDCSDGSSRVPCITISEFKNGNYIFFNKLDPVLISN